MLDATDQATFLAIRELKRSIQESNKPLVLWVGAGASKWLGYPLWKEVALDLRKDFFKYVATFDNAGALKLIDAGSFPRFFQQCRDLDHARYHRFLSDSFLPRPDTPIYLRFTQALGRIAPLHILTTNVDESIEQRFPGAAVFQRSDISGCLKQLQDGNPFIAKLHGSRSSIECTVFTDEDYEKLKADTGYVNTLKVIFATATVVFLGYSVSDQYLIDLLSDNERDMSLFGAGPHFVVSTAFKETPSVRRISYSLKRFPDHRTALTVLDIVLQVEARKSELAARPVARAEETGEGRRTFGAKTAYFISDFMPPGTWTNSLTLGFKNNADVDSELTTGLGFTVDEVLFRESTAPHDLIVGLICFDVVCLPLTAIDRVFMLIGDSLWPLVETGSIGFIHLQHEPAFVSAKGALTGDVGLVTMSSSTGDPQSAGELLRRVIKPNPGKETEGEKLISDVESRIIPFTEADKIELANLVRASFMMPEVSRLLGIGEAILPTQIPTWLRFPCLRMAHLVHTGAICDHFGIQAAKIPFGGVRLTSAAFGVQSSAESADHYASYVLSQRFNTDVGAALIAQPAILQTILRFRDTAEGEAFRREVRDQLLANAASEFSASINAGLKKNIPIPVLEKARDKLSSLLTENVSISPVPAVWANSLRSDDTTRFWRAKSRSILLDLAKQRGIRGDDPCICGSGDKFRLCCLAPLRD
ncbi:MAG: SIR2 family protein [Terriglobales bacterium]|jgi:hypothetical protein